MQKFKVLLNSVDGHWLQGMTVAFEEKQHFKVQENIDSGQLLVKAMEMLPEVLIWRTDEEPNQPDIREVLVQCPHLIMVLVVDDPNRFEILKLLQMGIYGCLPARLLPRQIVHAVELIVIAGVVCLPRLNREQLKNTSDRKLHIPINLTVREREILSLLCQNYSNQEIANSMCLAESTIKTHLHNIFRKMGVTKRSEAIDIVYGKSSDYLTSN